jgi:NADP-dependent 3-hydroxy acid dehydrogenase YdfG
VRVLQGKTALVTGAAGGIGQAIAWALAERARTSRRIIGTISSDLTSLATRVERWGGRAVVVVGDVRSENAAVAFVAQAIDALAQIDIHSRQQRRDHDPNFTSLIMSYPRRLERHTRHHPHRIISLHA